MTELVLILGVATVGLGLAGYLTRWVLARPVGDPEMNRVANLARMASEAFSRRQSRTVGALSALLAGVVFLSYGLRSGEHDVVPGLESGMWLTGSLALGALSSVLVGQIATFLFTRSTIRAASGARRSVDQALVLGLRAGAVVGLLTSTLSALGHAALLLAIVVYHGALGDDGAAALAIVPHAPLLVVGYALGAAFAGLLAQLSSSVFAKASDIGADVGGREVGLLDDDLENPAAVADLAGDCAFGCGGRATTAFASATTEDLAAMLVGAVVFEANPSLKSALAIVLLPLLARVFGVLGAAFGVMVVRTDETEDPRSALVRGLAVAAGLHAVGLAGAAKWLLPDHYVELVACVALGAVASLVLLPVAHYVTLLRGPVRDLAEASRAGASLNLLGGISLGLDGLLAPAALIGAIVLGAYSLGERTGLASGGLFGLAIATLGLLGVTPYLLAIDAAAAVLDSASGIVSMTVGRDRPDVRGRLLALDVVGTSSKAFARLHGATSAGASGLLLVGAFFAESTRRESPPASLSATDPLLYVAALFGLVLVVWIGARALSAVGRASRRVVDEVRRQLEGRHLGAAGGSPSERAVDHGACVEIASRMALRSMNLPAFGAVVAPALFVLGVRLRDGGSKPGVAAAALASVVITATVSAAVAALAMAISGGAWQNAKKYIVTGAHGGRIVVDEGGSKAENPTFFAALVGDAVGDAAKDAALGAIVVFAKMLPILALVMLPFLA